MDHSQRNREVYTLTLKTAEGGALKERINEVHTAVREYLGEKLCFAPIYSTSPRKILELGCGNGAWAIEAATAFPDASVLAVDIKPTIETTPLPQNLEFQLVDLTKDWPFKDATFDVVHVRLLLLHIPDGKSVLEHAAKLVKPGGWLVVEDIDHRRIFESGGPGVSKVIGIWLEILKARGADGEIAQKVESIIENSGMFSGIHSQIATVSVCKYDSGPENLRGLGKVMKGFWYEFVDHLADGFSAEGMTRDLATQFKEEMDEGVPEVFHEMYFVWAQRSL
ncbi:S-adenosyl-L-methionine-dependent methyltransferase [Mycena rebaudengoi]|nr:S-adenosyl-L-methionine-dependent methyltransferase [Mycena rebaudengoi]